jgi:membrane fusion protein (multidrug efflux system)
LRRRLGKRFVRVLAGTSFILIMALSGLYFFGYLASYESTDDAFITADVVEVAPKLAGKIERILVADNQMVKQGDPLVEIDSRDYEAQLRQKQAALESVRAQAIAAWAGVEQQIAKVKSLQANVDGNTADEVAAQAQADQTADDLGREQVLYKRHVVCIQDLTHAQVANRAAQAGLDSVKKKIVAAQAEFAEGEAQVRTYQALYQYVLAQEKQSEASLESAQLNVSYTRLYASSSGRVTHKSVQAGDYVQVGQALFALIPQDIYVTANFKEDQLRLMRAGQPVKIAIDALGGLRFPGHVDSIQMGSGAAFSLLPPENASGN